MSLSQRILAVLGESPLPVSTPDLALLCLPAGKRNAAPQVWCSLYRLERAGLVRRARVERHRPLKGRAHPCRACGRVMRVSARGMCARCYHDPATRAAWPPPGRPASVLVFWSLSGGF